MGHDVIQRCQAIQNSPLLAYWLGSWELARYGTLRSRLTQLVGYTCPPPSLPRCDNGQFRIFIAPLFQSSHPSQSKHLVLSLILAVPRVHCILDLQNHPHCLETALSW